MNEMIVRVAQAILREQQTNKSAFPNTLDLARVAIEAMREPSNEMLNAGWATTSTHVIDGRPEEIWPAMIDAALQEKTDS